MTVVIFAGPSLHGVPFERLGSVTVLPPAECGDVARAVRNGARAIGLIDGLFETAASVWHKELLWVLSKGIPVYGSSSMGALRAAEMWPFGMRGVGWVFRLYRRGAIIDDDEVALLHGPREAGSIPLTEALVNIRATLRAARRAAVLTTEGECGILQIAKSLFYKERTYRRIFKICADRPHLSAEAHNLRRSLAVLRRDVKRDDALLLLSKISSPSADQRSVGPPQFVRTSFWDDLEREKFSP